jgi:tRNA-splicing ligase RtcB
MPDVHLGIGATVGSVVPTKGAVIPAAVGVDIGCGMNAVRLSISASDLPDNLHRIRSAIEAAVPVGSLSIKRARFAGLTTPVRREHSISVSTLSSPGIRA